MRKDRGDGVDVPSYQTDRWMIVRFYRGRQVGVLSLGRAFGVNTRGAYHAPKNHRDLTHRSGAFAYTLWLQS